jgi:type I restriction enzyme M protein
MLFVNARKLGTMVDRTHRELLDDDMQMIANTLHAWRGEPVAPTYEDVPGFCASATIEEVAENNYVLTPARYVGTEEEEEDGEPIEEKISRLKGELYKAMDESLKMDAQVRSVLGQLDV